MSSPAELPLGSKIQNEDDNSQEGIVVAIRMRPLNSAEGSKRRIWKVLPKYASVAQTKKNGKPLSDRVTGRTFFTFDKTFGEDVNTVQVYDNVAKPIVSSVVSGLNGTIFAYGQTSSGKTYTMQGAGSIQQGSHSEGGIVHMAAKDIFSQINSQRERIFLVRASFLEIYNEEVRDLLSDSNQTLQVREDPRRGVFVQSVEDIVTNFESLLKILFHGEKSRQIAATSMNERSSRSHTIFRITIESRERELDDGDKDVADRENYETKGDGAVRVSTLNLVDLAGSESVRHTGATGERQKEGGMINQSLLTLSRVIVSLGTPNQMHINFRDSKLTRILQPSLSGNAKMAVICCATPSELYLEETRSTLQFASRAKLVKTNAQVNEVLDDRSIIRRLQKELAEARRNSTAPGTEHLRALETRAVTAGTAAMEAKAKLDRLKESILNAGYLFGAQNETENVENQSSMLRIGDNNRKAKKRRQSDGEILLNFRSPSKILIASNGATPLTEPKKRKKKQIRHLKVSPKSELYIVREALSSRTKFTKALQNTVKQLKESISDIEDRFKQEKVVNENQVGEFQLRYAELEQEKAKDESEIAFSAAENQKLSAEGEDLRSQYEDLQNRYCHLKQQQNQLSSENKAAQQQNIGLVAELENFKVQINEVESLLSTEEEKARSLKENFEATEEHLSSIAHDKLRLERELEDTKQEYSKTIQTLKEEKDGLTTELDKSCRKNNVLLANHVTLEKDSDDISARLSSTEQLVVDLQSQLEAAQQVTVNQETEKHTLKTFLIEAQETISALEQKIVSADEQITQICADKESKMSQQEQAYKELESRFTASRTEVESLTVEKASDQEIVASLEHKLIEFEEQIDQVSEEKESIVSILETRLVTSQQEVESLKTENTDAHGTINSLQDQINQVRTEKESLVSELEKNLADVNQQVKLLKSEKGSAQKVIASLEQKLIEYEEEMEQVNEEKESIISNIENRLTASQKEVHLLKAEKAETDGTIAALKQKVLSEQEQNDCLCKEKKSIISDLEEKESVVSDLESRLAASKEDFDSLNSKMTQTQEHATSLERNLTATKEQMEQNKTELEQQIASTNEELATKNDENKCLQTTIYDSQQTISSFEEKLASTEEQFEQLFGEISELQGLIETSGRNLESLKSEKMDLEARKDSLEKEKAELDIKRQELENENTEISADKESIIAEQKEAYMELEARLGDLFKGLESLQSEKGALEQKLVATEVKMEKVSSEKEAVASELHIRLVESSRKIESLQAQKYDLETRIEELESGLDCQLQELEEKSLKLEAENDELKNEVFNSGVKDVEIESEIMQAKTKMTAVLAQKDALEATLSESQLHAHQLEDRLDFARAEKKEYLTTTALRLDEQQKMIDEMTKRKEELESEVMALKKIENDFEHKQTLKENLTKRLHEREVERDEVTLELEKQYERNRELSRSLADCLPKEKETQLLSDISELKTQNIEFKQLLMSSNESEERSRNVVSELESECNTKTRELHDVLYRVSQLEEELRLSEKPGNNGSKQHQDELLDELEALASEKAETQNLLKREREERFIAEEELKKKMGDEQRILINEAESRMTDLRIRTENLERSLEQSEAEGYRARQVAEELRDQNKDVEERCVNYEGTVTGLNSSIERQESQISGLQSELNRAKADSYALKESAIEMKDKVRKASRDNEKAFRESQIASSELAALKRKIASLEHNLAEKRDESDRLRMKLRATEQEDASRKTGETVKELQETIQSKDDLVVNLNSTVAKLASQNASLATELKTSQATILKSQGNEDSNRLQKNIVRLNDQMRQKDSRIKKLEAVRLTKEQVESIKKLKSDNISFEKKCASLAREKIALESKLESLGNDGGSSLQVELSELRFDKEALESKLRKFAGHCQRLEDDRAGMIDALKSCNIDASLDDDINDAIISLCDKVASLEEGKSRRSSGESKFLQRLKEDNKILISKIEKGAENEQHLEAKVSECKKRIEALETSVEDSNENANGTKSEMDRKLRFLEQENLQLMVDNKSTKKQLQGAREEIEMLRMNAVENPTMDFSTVDFGISDTIDFSSLGAEKRKRTSILKESKESSLNENANNEKNSGIKPVLSARKRRHLSSHAPLENTTNIARGKSNRTPGVKKARVDHHKLEVGATKARMPGSDIKRTLTPGLGEASMIDDENTAECKQS